MQNIALFIFITKKRRSYLSRLQLVAFKKDYLFLRRNVKKNSHLFLGDGIIFKTFSQKSIIFLDKFEDFTSYDRDLGNIRGLVLANTLTIPIIENINDKINCVGVIEIINKRNNSTNNAEIGMLNQIANNIQIPIITGKVFKFI